MAPIDPSFFSTIARYLPQTIAICHLCGVVWLILSCILTITDAYQALPVSQRVRALERPRLSDILKLSFLAVISFLLHLHHWIDEFIDSYETWQQKAGHSVHTKDVWSSPLWLYTDPATGGMLRYLGLRRTSLEASQEALLSFVSSSRDYWWTQQRFTALVIWGIFVAIESNRRNIPKDTVMKLMALPSIVGLACAQNIFNILLLVTPVPLPDRSKADNKKPKTWTIRSEVYSLFFGVACVFYLSLPSLISTEYFKYQLMIYVLAIMLPATLIQSKFTPRSWGSTYHSSHEAHRAHLQLFRNLSLGSFVMQCVSTAAAINSEAHLSPIRVRNATWIVESNPQTSWSAMAQTSLQILKTLLGTISGNPVVSQVAWDVLLTGLNLCVWVGIRELRPRDLYAATWIAWLSNEDVPAAKSLHRRSHSQQHSHSHQKSALRSGSLRFHAESDEEYIDEDPDADYVPPTSVQPDVDVIEHEEEAEPETTIQKSESTALAWGLLVFGGLGFGGASVWGADAVSR